MKRVIIIHCWNGYPEYCWYPQTRKELESKDFDVEVPSMPDTDRPKLSLWLPALREIIEVPDENLFLVGHSIGCVTILRYLESLPEGMKIGGVVLVAGFTDNLGFQELDNFFETELDFETIKTRANKFVLIHSDNDPFVEYPKYADILQEKLGAELIFKPGEEHFSGEVEGETTKTCKSLPEVAQSILKLKN